MEITGVDFVAVPSTDWKRSRAFYVDTLGLRPDATGQAEFWVGQTCFGIYEPTTFGLEFAPQTTAHLALHVDDVATARADLEAKGVEFEGDDLRHRRLPHGVLQRPGRQRPDAPPPLLAARGGRRVVITVERADFVAVPVTDMERSIRFYGETLGLPRDPRRRAGRSSSSARTSSLYLHRPDEHRPGVRGPAHGAIALRVPDVESARQRARGEGRHVLRRDVRHRRLPHGAVRRPRRQRADAPPEVRAP